MLKFNTPSNLLGTSLDAKMSPEKKPTEARLPPMGKSSNSSHISREKRKSLLFTNPNLALGLVARSPSSSPALCQGNSPASDSISQITSSGLSGRTPTGINFSKLTNLAGYSIDISPLEGSVATDDNFGTRVE